MRRTRSVFGPACLCLLWWSAAPARADFLSWSCNFAHTTPEILSDRNPKAGIRLLYGSLASHFTGLSGHPAGIILAPFSGASSSHPDTFSGQAFNVVFDLTDDASHTAGAVAFSGRLYGKLTAARADITAQFSGPLSQTLHLGRHFYFITLDQFPALPPPGSGNRARLSVEVIQPVVDPMPPGQSAAQTLTPAATPEPAALTLAVVGVAFLALCYCRRGKPVR